MDNDIYRTVIADFDKPSKSQRRQMQILEEAIHQYASRGIESTTHQHIAEACGISRALVQHYFPDRDELALTAIKLVRARLQQIAVEAITAARTPEAQLEAYIRSTFQWIEKYRMHAKVWLLFYYYCGIRPRHRAMNTELVNLGHVRIAALLKAGGATGAFARGVSDAELALRAKWIQDAITGALLAALTENLPKELTLDELQERTVGHCRLIARAEASGKPG